MCSQGKQSRAAKFRAKGVSVEGCNLERLCCKMCGVAYVGILGPTVAESPPFTVPGRALSHCDIDEYSRVVHKPHPCV